MSFEMSFDRMDFYGMGEINVLPSAFSELDRRYEKAVAFRFTGSDTKSALVLIDGSLDLEMGKELGNILASKVAGQLSENEGWEVLISPPQVWEQEKLKTIPKATKELQFELRLADRTVLVPVLLFNGETVHV